MNAIELLGFVEDIQPLFSRCALFVCPIRSGSGVRVKLLEAFASGIPVVSTTLGAEGLAREDGDFCFLADDAPAFAAKVVQLLEDEELAAPHGRARQAGGGGELGHGGDHPASCSKYEELLKEKRSALPAGELAEPQSVAAPSVHELLSGSFRKRKLELFRDPFCFVVQASVGNAVGLLLIIGPDYFAGFCIHQENGPFVLDADRKVCWHLFVRCLISADRVSRAICERTPSRSVMTDSAIFGSATTCITWSCVINSARY